MYQSTAENSTPPPKKKFAENVLGIYKALKNKIKKKKKQTMKLHYCDLFLKITFSAGTKCLGLKAPDRVGKSESSDRWTNVVFCVSMGCVDSEI